MVNDMARYIDADKLIKKIFPIGMVDDGNYTINAKAVKVAIDKTPTVDVEKERLESASFRFALLDSIKRSKIAIAEHDRELAREIFEEIDYFVTLYKEGHFSEKSLLECIADLKKKYTKESEREHNE